MKLEKIVSYLKQTGYVFQGSEIYGGLANTFDYGPLGSLLKDNLKRAWKKRFITESKYNVLFDSSILLNKEVWQASGHLAGFNDPLTECLSCNNRFRADHLITNYDNSINCDGWSNEKLLEFLNDKKIACPVCGKLKWSEIRQFNLMFKTNQGVIDNEANLVYLRPETAQGIFINFKNIQRTTRRKLPFGVGQVGKAFRNEITPGNFIFRTREFEQLELEFFCQPQTELKWFDYWLEEMKRFLVDLGLKKENISYHEHNEEELSHYSNKTIDILYNYPWGFDELWGIASRTDFDLKAHEVHSGVDMTYLDNETNEKYHPYVVEPSLGVERLFLAVIKDSLTEETLPDGTTRELLKIHPFLAPYQVAVFPLIRKRHQAKAEAVYELLSKELSVLYDETQTIGKRYRRQDQIGTPFAVTIDDETLANEKMLLPSSEDAEEEDPREALVQKLIEYKKYKEAARMFDENFHSASKHLYKTSQFTYPDINAPEDISDVLSGVTIDEIFKAFCEVLKRKELKTDKIRSGFKTIYRDLYSVEDKMKYIKNLLTLIPKVSFFEIFAKDTEKAEIITTFLALLELIKLREVTVAQENIFEEILITKNIGCDYNETLRA